MTKNPELEDVTRDFNTFRAIEYSFKNFPKHLENITRFYNERHINPGLWRFIHNLFWQGAVWGLETSARKEQAKMARREQEGE